jgi:linoleoyl-CoA desaturase
MFDDNVSILRRELQEADVFAHRTLASFVKFLCLAAMALGLWVAALCAPLWATFLLGVVAAVPVVSAAMCGHEAAHGAFSAQPWKNEAMLHLAFPLFTGLGVLHWRHKHNVLHHGHPNVVGTDDDVDLWPMALCHETYAQSPWARRWFQKYLQGVLFWPLTLTLSFVMRVETWKATLLTPARVRCHADRAPDRCGP